MENLVSGAPTLPIDVLLYDEHNEKSIEDALEEVGEPPAQ
jgi:DNA helicase-2/ATP-dependent DNA helicase PcrA